MQVPHGAADVEMAQALPESGPFEEVDPDADMDTASGDQVSVFELAAGRLYEDEHSRALSEEIDAAPDKQPPQGRQAVWVPDLSRMPQQYNSRTDLTDHHRVRKQPPDYSITDLLWDVDIGANAVMAETISMGWYCSYVK